MEKNNTVISGATVINEGRKFKADIFIEDGYISEILTSNNSGALPRIDEHFNAENMYLFPGFIDTHVHFREPGLTHKANMFYESRAAAAAGVTSCLEMPNTLPAATNADELERKFRIAEYNSIINISFFAGATNNNINDLLKLDYSKICGIKVFMGSSTGNMLVNNDSALEDIFKESKVRIALHCEDEDEINRSTELIKQKYGENPPFSVHPLVRNRTACLKSSLKAVELSEKYGTKIHITHISTKEELALLKDTPTVENKQITAEACIAHLFFSDQDYAKYGSLIKCNPSIKTEDDREALCNALSTDKIDSIATDHAPHTKQEKANSYFKAPSGMPSVQFASSIIFDFCQKGILSLEQMAEKMCHAPAKIFKISKRGFIREGYFADLAIINPCKGRTITDAICLSKCGFTPFNNMQVSSVIAATFVNGRKIFSDNKINEISSAKFLSFNN